MRRQSQAQRIPSCIWPIFMPKPMEAPMASHHRGSSVLSAGVRRSKAVSTQEEIVEGHILHEGSVAPRQTGRAAAAATPVVRPVCRRVREPSSRWGALPTATASTTAAKKRKPVSEVRKNDEREAAEEGSDWRISHYEAPREMARIFAGWRVRRDGAPLQRSPVK